MITVVSSVIEGERNFLMIIMGGYSDDLSDHCVFGLIFLQNWLTQFTQIWVLSQAKTFFSIFLPFDKLSNFTKCSLKIVLGDMSFFNLLSFAKRSHKSDYCLSLTKKFLNLQYNTLVRWDAGTNESSTKRLMFQALSFFIISYRLGALKTPGPQNSFFYYKKI